MSSNFTALRFQCLRIVTEAQKYSHWSFRHEFLVLHVIFKVMADYFRHGVVFSANGTQLILQGYVVNNGKKCMRETKR